MQIGLHTQSFTADDGSEVLTKTNRHEPQLKELNMQDSLSAL